MDHVHGFHPVSCASEWLCFMKVLAERWKGQVQLCDERPCFVLLHMEWLHGLRVVSAASVHVQPAACLKQQRHGAQACATALLNSEAA